MPGAWQDVASTMSSAPQPLAHGTLEATPLDHVVLSLHRKKLAGTLAVWPDAPGTPGQDRILFKNGQVIAAKLVEPASALDRGLLPLFRRTRAAYAFYAEDLLGDRSAVVSGHVDTNALVLAAMRGGMREDVVDGILARFDGSAVRLIAGYDFGKLGALPKEMGFIELLRAGPSPIPSLLVQSGDPKIARRMLYVLAISQGIEPYALPVVAHEELPTLDAPQKPSTVVYVETPRGSELDGLLSSEGRPSGVDVRPSDFPFPDAKLSTARSQPAMSPVRPTGETISMSGMTPVRPPGSGSGMTPARSNTSASGMTPVRAGNGAARPDPRRVAKAPEPPPPVPEGLERALAQKWADVSARFVSIDTETYFQMLGVSEICTPEEVRDAYFSQVKAWHPDRLPEGLETLKPFVDRIFHHLTAARDVLSEEQKRQAYQKTVAQGAGKPSDDRKLEAILTAAGEFEKAQVLANRAKWDEVLEQVAICIELDPENADYIALKGWAVLQMAPLDAKGAAKDAVTIAEQALRLTKGAHHERAVLTKAIALQRLGRAEDAHECFRKVVERNPKNLEAAREVRLYEMRARNSIAPKPDSNRPEAGGGGGGLLSKFFGGKKP